MARLRVHRPRARKRAAWSGALPGRIVETGPDPCGDAWQYLSKSPQFRGRKRHPSGLSLLQTRGKRVVFVRWRGVSRSAEPEPKGHRPQAAARLPVCCRRAEFFGRRPAHGPLAEHACPSGPDPGKAAWKQTVPLQPPRRGARAFGVRPAARRAGVRRDARPADRTRDFDVCPGVCRTRPFVPCGRGAHRVGPLPAPRRNRRTKLSPPRLRSMVRWAKPGPR